MTEYELRAFVATQARSWLNLKEADGSFKPIIDTYNSISPLPNGYRMKYTDPWCAAFVSAVAQKCGLTGIIFPNASCPRMIDLYQRAGRWQEDENYLPQVGDIVFYDWQDDGVGDNRGVADHVGLVVSVSGNSFNVVEGNYSDAVKQRTIRKNSKNLRGFGLPDYAKAAAVTGGQSAPSATAGTQPTQNHTVTPVVSNIRPVLRFGAKSSYVKTLQDKLVSLGYDLPKYGADGKFGRETLEAVIKFQGDNSLVRDGIVGPKTWAAIDSVSVGKPVIVTDVISPSAAWTPAVGDIVMFTGKKHYPTAMSQSAHSCIGGKAKITSIYKLGSAAHPYHLVNLGNGCTVYGWVDAGTFRKA